MSGPATDLYLFLGGHDLEMETIAALARDTLGPERVHDAGLAWGARASAYADDIAEVLAEGGTPVLVELGEDLSASIPQDRLIVIDHHGARAGRDAPSSLRQVFDRLALPPERWTRWFELVAANDIGHMAALRALGASADEIRRVRDADRKAQGVTEADEQAARTALESLERRGALTLVRSPTERMSPIADFLEPEYGGQGAANLLILTPREAGFFGEGRVVQALAGDPGSWFGGALPNRGFWGHRLNSEAEGDDLAVRVESLVS